MLTTFHIMAITGLTPNTIYYWRPISHGSGEALGQELVFATVTSQTSPPIVETPGTPGTPGTPTEGEIPAETETPELTPPAETGITAPEITEAGQGQGMLSGLLAAVGNLFSATNLCPLLLLLILILIALLGLSIYRSRKKEFRIWIISIIILILILIYRGRCYGNYWWMIIIITAIIGAVSYYLGDKKDKGKQEKIEFLK